MLFFWTKVNTNLFSNRKIKIIFKEREGDIFFIIWIQIKSINLERLNEVIEEKGLKKVLIFTRKIRKKVIFLNNFYKN